MAQLYICTQAFVSNRHGRETWVAPPVIAEAGAWPLDVSPGSFVPLVIDYPAPGSDLAEQKPPQQHPPAPEAKPEPKDEALKPEPHHERKAAAHKPARKG